MSDNSQRLEISPATLSRFTTIAVTPYSPSELHHVLQQRLQALLCRPGGGGFERGVPVSEVQHLLAVLGSLTAFTEHELRATVGLRQLLRCVAFVDAHTCEPSMVKRLLLGFRFLVLDSLEPDPERQQQLAVAWLVQQQQQGHGRASGSAANTTSQQHQLQAAVEAAFELPYQEAELLQADRLLRMLPGGYLQLRYTGLAARLAADDLHPANLQQPQQVLTERMRLSCTPSLVLSMARILAAASIQGPLLLEGPPGVGKTVVVQQVASLLGFGCERINLSANTTLEQLLGAARGWRCPRVCLVRWCAGVSGAAGQVAAAG